MKVLHLESQNFEKEVLEETKTVLVDFYADWCRQCKMMSPVVEKIAEELGAEYRFVRFHPSYDYTDFVEGLRPVNENGQVIFEYDTFSFCI